jgi:hypothetical protein
MKSYTSTHIPNKVDSNLTAYIYVCVRARAILYYYIFSAVPKLSFLFYIKQDLAIKRLCTSKINSSLHNHIQQLFIYVCMHKCTLLKMAVNK